MSLNKRNIAILGGCVAILLALLKNNNQTTRLWVHPYLAARNKKGRFLTAFHDLSDRFCVENFHMDRVVFNKIYEKIEVHLKYKRNTRPKDRIPGKMRLAVVLEYLASGTIGRHMSSIYRISQLSFGKILDQVCDAIIYEFQYKFMEFTNDNWLSVAKEFNLRWNFPICLGATDGKHIAITCPKQSGTLFYNYKKFYSIVMMAIADANYKFIYVNVGGFGSEGDGGIFGLDTIGRRIYRDELPLPADAENNGCKVPFYFIADHAFTLGKRIMKPYKPQSGTVLTEEENIFNYRLSRARRCVENAFGILSKKKKWLCLTQILGHSPQRVSKIVLTCSILHNLLLHNRIYCPPGFADYYDSNGNVIEGEWNRPVHNHHFFRYFWI